MTHAKPDKEKAAAAKTGAEPKAVSKDKPRRPDAAPADAAPPREVGRRDGPEPTRYGDWEKNGRCVDF